ncbi:PEP-CTERM sorting domain-containing protein [Scytonema sp. NUACC26]|uniref:PEP-CTERM sorting domain-containing protein n=1 Tax=Scytonema sp. NUACC26 TaxID=3140176 RepID=UPI0034DCC343
MRSSTVNFYLYDTDNTGFDGILLEDDLVEVDGSGNAYLEPVPEPFTVLGSMTALALGVGMRRRAKKKTLA